MQEYEVIGPGETKTIPTGICFETRKGYEVQVRPKDGLSSRGIFCALVTIDSDYRGEVSVILYNSAKDGYVVERGSKIAQAVIVELPDVNLKYVNAPSKAARFRNEYLSMGRDGNYFTIQIP